MISICYTVKNRTYLNTGKEILQKKDCKYDLYTYNIFTKR